LNPPPPHSRSRITMTQLRSIRSLAVLAAIAGPSALLAQRAAVRVSLDDALRLAQAASPTVDIARAGALRAAGAHDQAASQFLPQLNGTASYSKTLKSQFEGLFSGGSSDTTKSSSGSSGGGIDFSQAGFGAKNQWTLGIQASQNVFTGGRITGQR